MVKYSTGSASDKNYNETDFSRDMKPSIDKIIDSIIATSTKRLGGTGKILSGTDSVGDRQFIYNQIYPIARQSLYENNDSNTAADLKLYNWIIAIVAILLILAIILGKYILAHPLNTKYTLERLGETLIISGIASLIVVLNSGKASIKMLVGQVDLTGIESIVTPIRNRTMISLIPTILVTLLGVFYIVRSLKTEINNEKMDLY